MNELNLAVSMIEAEAREYIAAAETIEDKFKAAFDVAKNHWMFTDKNTQFKAGVGAVMVGLGRDDDDYQRVQTELLMLRSVSALLSGVPVDLNQIGDEDFKAIGIRKLWDKANEST